MNIPKPLVFISLLFLVQTLYGQKRSPARPFVPPPRKVVFGDVCVKNANLSFAARIKKYPFNGSAQVQLISFEGSVQISSDSEFVIRNAVPAIIEADYTISDTTMKESKALTLSQIDTLTGILYNYGVPRISAGEKMITTKSESGCYIPRNAILFRDSNGKALAFIEICFECSGTRLSDKRISLGDTCGEKLNMIKQFFIKAGIRYGTQE
ncbi:hypothetical protein [Chitinophaga sp. S165]|uniref:hypothetical protein n=1 Tax=Chitinophaga sp. S165 TaxID=2135462 RepID=UPI000D71AA07|nr:hypothetical protein [Chitinophaga sp. S165]PWV57014.1 hypothetical protein C7475_1011534 [Chitinophaga sp. S165]